MQIFVKTLTGKTIFMKTLTAKMQILRHNRQCEGQDPKTRKASHRTSNVLFSPVSSLRTAELSPTTTSRRSQLSTWFSVFVEKKRMKKTYTKPKKIKHKHMKVQLSVLQFYKVDDSVEERGGRGEDPNGNNQDGSQSTAGLNVNLHKMSISF
ncbi:hypothetical protein LXL04_037343 [Taraxacum kok-saghyz]